MSLLPPPPAPRACNDAGTIITSKSAADSRFCSGVYRAVGQRLADRIIERVSDVADWGIPYCTLVGDQHAQPQRNNSH